MESEAQADRTNSSKPKYSGQCFCSGVKFEVADAEPLLQTFCHCNSCQRYHSAASVACMLFRVLIEDGKVSSTDGKFKIVEGEDLLTTYQHKPESFTRRIFCKKCGTPVVNSIPAMGVINLFPSSFQGKIAFKPVSHSNYEDKILVVRDGLPKYKGYTGSELVDDEGRPIPKEKEEQVANLANDIEKIEVFDHES